MPVSESTGRARPREVVTPIGAVENAAAVLRQSSSQEEQTKLLEHLTKLAKEGTTGEDLWRLIDAAAALSRAHRQRTDTILHALGLRDDENEGDEDDEQREAA